MKIKTYDLNLVALDWAVAVCEKSGVTGIAEDGKLRSMPTKPFGEPTVYSPSSDWSQGGKIIERERIRITPFPPGREGEGWVAGIYDKTTFSDFWASPTPLIAAMRCYVASKLGDEVDVPNELSNKAKTTIL